MLGIEGSSKCRRKAKRENRWWDKICVARDRIKGALGFFEVSMLAMVCPWGILDTHPKETEAMGELCLICLKASASKDAWMNRAGYFTGTYF